MHSLQLEQWAEVASSAHLCDAHKPLIQAPRRAVKGGSGVWRVCVQDSGQVISIGTCVQCAAVLKNIGVLLGAATPGLDSEYFEIELKSEAIEAAPLPKGLTRVAPRMQGGGPEYSLERLSDRPGLAALRAFLAAGDA